MTCNWVKHTVPILWWTSAIWWEVACPIPDRLYNDSREDKTNWKELLITTLSNFPKNRCKGQNNIFYSNINLVTMCRKNSRQPPLWTPKTMVCSDHVSNGADRIVHITTISLYTYFYIMQEISKEWRLLNSNSWYTRHHPLFRLPGHH